MALLVAHAKIAPSFKDFDLSGTTRSGSTIKSAPSPEHLSQAPYGALNENILGVNSSKLRLQSGQASFSEKTIYLSPTTSTTTIPSAFFKAI